MFLKQSLVKGICFFGRCGLPLACRNEVLKAVLYKVCPGFVAHFVAFIMRYEALVGEAQFRLPTSLSDLEDHLCINPLAFVLCEVEMVVQDVPDHFLFGDELDDLDPASVDVLVMIIVYAVELISDAFYALGPPCARVIDGGEYFSRSPVYQEGGGKILLFHILLFWVNGVFSETKATQRL